MSVLAMDRPKRKWYHVVWRTHRRRPLFKIPAARRFCERELQRLLRAHGWEAGDVYVGATQLHVLVRCPRRSSRDTVIREVKRLAARAARAAGAARMRGALLWGSGAWCTSVTDGAQLAATRRWLAGRRGATSSAAATAPL